MRARPRTTYCSNTPIVDDPTVTCEALRDSEARIGAHRWRLEGKDDAIFRNAFLDKTIRDPILSTIVLNPHLSVANIDMDNTSMDSVLSVPASIDQFVVILHLV